MIAGTGKMGPGDGDAPEVRRILVALDASADSFEALEAGAVLAARLGAELLGLFVEDVNLLRAAEFPAAQRVSLLTATSHAFSAETLASEMRALAGRASAAVEAAARRRNLRWSFRTARGQIVHEVVAAGGEADLVVLGWVSQSRTRRRVGSTARAVAEQAGRSVLLLRPGGSVARTFVVLFDATAGAEKALATAARLVAAEGGNLAVLILDDGAAAESMRGKAEDWLAARGLVARIRVLADATVGRVCALVGAAEGGVLVIAADSALIAGEERETLFERVNCPILLVR